MKKMIKVFKELLRKMFDDSEICPHCGVYCTGKTVYCNEPLNLKKRS